MPNYSSPFTPFTGINRDFLQVNPQSSYNMWLGAQGATPDNTNMYNYGKGLYDYYQQDYYGKSAKEPGLDWLSYLDTMGGSNNLGNMWGGLAPSKRGQSDAPMAQWRSGPFGQVR